MSHDAVEKQGPPIPGWVISYLVLAVMLAASVWLWRFSANAEQAKAQSQFSEYCEQISEDIAGRLDTYSSILQSAAGIFIVSDEVTREKWRRHYEHRRVSCLLPGFHGIAYAEVVAPAELARHVERIRVEGFPEYAVWPDGERPVYAPAVFMEPFDPTNRRALGFDSLSEPTRRAAMERARDTASVAMSDRLSLVVDDTEGDVQAGFMLYVPVFATGVPPGDVEARRKAVTGYVHGALRVKDFMRSAFAEAPEKVAFELYDGETISPDALLFASRELGGGPDTEHRARFFCHTPLKLYGKTWSLAFRSTPQFEAGQAPNQPWIILAAGLAISILVFLLMRSQQNVAAKSAALAESLATSLRDSKQAEEAIRTSEERFRIAAENLTDVIYDWNLREKVDWHGDIDGILGYAAGEFPRTIEAWAATLHPEDQDRVLAALEAHVRGEAPYFAEYRVKRRDGEWRWWTARGTALRDEQGEPYRMIGSISDITERRRTEDALRESEQENARKAELLWQAPVIAAFHDRDNNIVWANRAYEEATGHLLKDLVGRKCYSCWNLSEPCQGCPVLTAIATGKPGEAELTPQNQRNWPESLASWLSRAAPVRDTDGNIIGAIEIAIDITDRKQAEAALRETNQALEAATARANEMATQAEIANRAKGAFLANMSHEIRTPLNAVLGFAQILERDASLTPRQAEMLHTIARSGRHLLDLINDILDMSKIEAGRLDLKPVDFCLHDLLDDLKMMFQSRAHAKQLQLLMERHDSVPRYVNADAGKLRQVMINLMSNAIKFTRIGGGAVRVRADTEPGGAAEPPSALRLVVEVEDSGPGIAEDELNLIFEPFRQSDAGREAGGTGLGLAVSRRLVELMGGRLTLKSQVGKGSCFRFDVRVKLAERAAQEVAPTLRQVVGLEPGTGTYRILVVDDQKDNRDLLAALLEPLGFEIREAVNGQEALDVFAAWSPHAVLMDIRIPTLDGYDATRRIKGTDQGRATPVIAVTASAFAEAEREVWAAGVDGYVCKPFRTEEIFAVLEKCLGLRYVYADTGKEAAERAGGPPLTREDLAAVPEAVRQAMRQAVDEGDMARLQALIAQVEETDAAAAGKLRNLADQRAYETLVQVLSMQESGDRRQKAGDGRQETE